MYRPILISLWQTCGNYPLNSDCSVILLSSDHDYEHNYHNVCVHTCCLCLYVYVTFVACCFASAFVVTNIIIINTKEQPTCDDHEDVLADNHTTDGHAHRSTHSARGPHMTGALAEVTAPVPVLALPLPRGSTMA